MRRGDREEDAFQGMLQQAHMEAEKVEFYNLLLLLYQLEYMAFIRVPTKPEGGAQDSARWEGRCARLWGSTPTGPPVR